MRLAPWISWIPLISLAVPLQAGADIAPPKDNTSAQVKQMIRDITILTPAAAEGRHLWCELGARTDVALSGWGGQLGAGFLLRFFGVDGRVMFGKAAYGSFAVDPGASQLPSANGAATDPASEANRPRGKQDPWSYALVEPGLSISGRMFGRALPLLSERGRVGFGYGTFHDGANSVDFTAYLFSSELSAFWQLGSGSRWSLAGSLAWYWGALYSNAAAGQDVSLGRLPASWVTGSVGLLYSF